MRLKLNSSSRDIEIANLYIRPNVAISSEKLRQFSTHVRVFGRSQVLPNSSMNIL